MKQSIILQNHYIFINYWKATGRNCKLVPCFLFLFKGSNQQSLLQDTHGQNEACKATTPEPIFWATGSVLAHCLLHTKAAALCLVWFLLPVWRLADGSAAQTCWAMGIILGVLPECVWGRCLGWIIRERWGEITWRSLLQVYRQALAQLAGTELGVLCHCSSPSAHPPCRRPAMTILSATWRSRRMWIYANKQPRLGFVSFLFDQIAGHNAIKKNLVRSWERLRNMHFCLGCHDRQGGWNKKRESWK